MTINLIVAGAGEGFYKTVGSVVHSTAPDLGMHVSAVIDVLPMDALHPKAQELIAEQRAALFHPQELDRLSMPENSAGVIMTPNSTHLWYAEFFTRIGVPVYVEKPAVVSLVELKKFLELAGKYPRLVYAAEYCNAGKALGLLGAAGLLRPNDPRRAYLSASSKMRDVYSLLGRLQRVRGKMLEGEGTRSTAEHRLWLLDGNQGGMVRDLLSHPFGTLCDLGLAGFKTESLRVKLGKHESGTPAGTYRPLKTAAEGETYACAEGNFATLYGSPAFEFEVGKYWPKNQRFLQLDFERGHALLNYEKPFELTIEAHCFRSTSVVTVDDYATLSFLDFTEFMEGRTHGNVGKAAAIVEFNELVRKTGLEQGGVPLK